jgi:hypothetical protein
MKKLYCILLVLIALRSNAQIARSSQLMHLNDLEYLQYQGVNVMLAHDFYPEGHQGGGGHHTKWGTRGYQWRYSSRAYSWPMAAHP